VLFVAGWVSAVDGWLGLLRALAERREVHYLETREKRSALIDPQTRLSPEGFSVSRMAKDVVAASTELGLGTDLVAIGSSLGATVLLEAMKGGAFTPAAAFLIAPNVRFKYPWWGYILLRGPAVSYHVVKHIVLFYLRHFRVKEPGQMQRYDVTLREADPARIKLSAMAFAGYEVWPGLDTIALPVAIGYGRSDGLHGQDDVTRLAKSLPRGQRVPCESNTYMHSAALATDLEKFEATI
jgi:pimeloyl-ACP methyl ester carboxylesterase